MERVHAAVDLGASSGRVMAGIVTDEGIRVEEVHRFGNAPVKSGGHLHWDIEALWHETLTGLQRLVARWPGVESIGIDTWAVDYGLLDEHDQLLGAPYCYRDDRTASVIDRVHEAISPERHYQITGLQHLPFNTLYQLAAEQGGADWQRARTILLLPDLLAHRLTGRAVAEVTNASTTGLLDATERAWSAEVLEAVGVDRGMLPELVEPGTTIGTVRPGFGLPAIPVIAVGSHDTASAVVGVPATGRRFGYISSGTWSLVGVELDRPVLSSASRIANFTNEGGVDATIRYLRNVGGLWLLDQCRQDWGISDADLPRLLTGAGALPVGGPVFDVDAPELIAPGDMARRISDAVREPAVGEAGGAAPEGPVTITRCILDSLALAYASTLSAAQELSAHGLSAQEIDVVHVVGGGSRNAVLCALTAEATGRPVLAGPVEATALGNIVIQARAVGATGSSLADLRRLIAQSSPVVRYDPSR